MISTRGLEEAIRTAAHIPYNRAISIDSASDSRIPLAGGENTVVDVDVLMIYHGL